MRVNYYYSIMMVLVFIVLFWDLLNILKIISSYTQRVIDFMEYGVDGGKECTWGWLALVFFLINIEPKKVNHYHA